MLAPRQRDTDLGMFHEAKPSETWKIHIGWSVATFLLDGRDRGRPPYNMHNMHAD